MAQVTEKMKKEQKDRINTVVMRLRHTISEAVNNNEITKIEGLIASACIHEELLKQTLVQAKLPAESSVERDERTHDEEKAGNC